jgi:hypothetical protein
MALPEFFVWTRYGTESGELANSILFRKEQERIRGKGIFLWGIGNSVGPSVRKLLDHLDGEDPAMVFSPMLAAPREVDVSPAEVLVWRRAHGLDGREWSMPVGSLVTSRAGGGASRKARHYALACYRDDPLQEDENAVGFAIKDLVNFASGNRVGHSQVTSVVKRVGRSAGGPYVAAIRAKLVYPYVVELTDPGDQGIVVRSESSHSVQSQGTAIEACAMA